MTPTVDIHASGKVKWKPFAGEELLVRIGEFARQAGVSPRSLRHYE